MFGYVLLEVHSLVLVWGYHLDTLKWCEEVCKAKVGVVALLIHLNGRGFCLSVDRSTCVDWVKAGL